MMLLQDILMLRYASLEPQSINRDVYQTSDFVFVVADLAGDEKSVDHGTQQRYCQPKHPHQEPVEVQFLLTYVST
jgi:hypothetical protein